MRRKTPLVALVLTMGLTAAAWADVQHPNLERGFSPDQSFAVGDFDHVNLFNGNLALTVPVGPRYPLGNGFSYGFTLSYNGKLWDWKTTVDGFGSYRSQATANRDANAGFGWLLSFGRLIAPNSYPRNDTPNWMYVSPDGAEHLFYSTLHGEPATPNVFYTRDGTYLRLKPISNAYELEFPDGRIDTFVNYGSGEWWLTRSRDRFNNWFGVAYLAGGTWQVTDSAGRVHHVYFRPLSLDGRTVNMVDRVDLAAFGGSVASYQLAYSAATVIDRPVPHDDDIYSSMTATVTFLTGVGLPDGSSYQMPAYHTSRTIDGPYHPGAIKHVTLPTLGRIEWSYGGYQFATGAEAPDPGTRSSPGAYHKASLGVSARRLIKASGALEGEWTYDQTLVLPASYPQEQPIESTTAVTTPLGHRTVHYFSAYVGGPTSTTASGVDYGLPLTIRASDGSVPPRYLSTETYHANGTKLRTSYVRFELDGPRSPGAPVSDVGNGDSNRREAGGRTIYHDDGGRFADSTRSDFDGLGHYRQVQTGGNFGAGNARTEVTSYNPGVGMLAYDASGNMVPGFQMLQPSAPWVLGTYTARNEIEGVASVQAQSCFDAATGFLRRRRAMKGTSPGANDVIAVFTPDAQGNVAREEYFGGDIQSVGTGSLCDLALPANQYGIQHTYASGSLQSSTYLTNVGGLFPFRSVDNDIDSGTGLVRASRDTSGIQTDYEYDPQGRLTWAKPGPGHGAWTEYAYARATSSAALASVTVRQRANGSKAGAVRTESQILFDDLGRVWRERQLMPNGTWSMRETLYNPQGWKLSVSELGNLTKKTQFLTYDPFGRPATITPPDGAAHNVTLSYAGVRSVSRTVKVGTAFNATTGAVTESSSTTTELYDRQGRLWQITEPSGAGGANVTTTYGYDPAGRLRNVQTAAAEATQTRSFVYDGRGFLTSEAHPENGTTTYSNYNARGHAERRVQGGHDLTFAYDRAERLVLVRETGSGFVDCVQNGGRRCLKTFDYAGANSGADLRRGKLVRADRYNYLMLSTTPHTALIRQKYTYAGRGGRVSERVVEHLLDGATSPNASIWQSWTYDDLGNVTHLEYPRFTAGACTNIPGGWVDNFYSRGRLTSASYLSSLTYHPNGMVHQVVHPNGITDTYANDPNGMARPASISATHVASGVPRWTTGAYAYDGAGNVKATGGSTYLYDGVSRLKEAKLLLGVLNNGTQVTQTYGYDSFGNLQSISGTGGRATPTNSSTNRLTGGTYDAAGNLTFWNGQRYDSDALGSMWRHCTDSRCYPYGEEWVHVYDADDERLFSYKLGPAITRWTPRDLDGKVLRQYTADPTLPCKIDSVYVYRDGLLAAEAVNEKYFSLDHLGTPRLITDRWGNNGPYHMYWPFGEEATSFNQDVERMKFTGHERDLGSLAGPGDDLDYMHQRYYSLLTGRFNSFDPVGGNPWRPQSWNRYAYVLGNPMKYIDPYGLVAECYDNRRCYEETTVTASPSDNEISAVQGLNSLILGGRVLSAGPEPSLTVSDRILSSIDADFAQTIGDSIVGFGDIVSFGFTEMYREEVGLAHTINEDSAAYTTGQVAGVAHGLMFGGAGAARAAGVQTKIALHGAHHSFGQFGRLRHIQLNWWRIGVKGSGRAFRIPLPWR